MSSPKHHGHDRDHDHSHDHGHGEHHGHTHGIVDPSIRSTDRGMWALKWSFAVLAATAIVQVMVMLYSGSVALLADTIHNFADAATAIPLAIAFWLGRRAASPRFTYGLGRAEDLAGLAVVAIIAVSAAVAVYESIDRLLHPRQVEMLWAVVAASVIGFVGNEGVAIIRIRVGRQIGSAALVADGYHARADGWTSLAVLAGVVGVWLGFPMADAFVGLAIAAAILVLVWQAGRTVAERILDGTDPKIVEAISHAAASAPHVKEVTDVRARWIGHRLHADVSITVPGALSVAVAHSVASEVRHQLQHHVANIGAVQIHVDPEDAAGDSKHAVMEHQHDGLPPHSHPWQVA